MTIKKSIFMVGKDYAFWLVLFLQGGGLCWRIHKGTGAWVGVSGHNAKQQPEAKELGFRWGKAGTQKQQPKTELKGRGIRKEVLFVMRKPSLGKEISWHCQRSGQTSKVRLSLTSGLIKWIKAKLSVPPLENQGNKDTGSQWSYSILRVFSSFNLKDDSNLQ